MRYSRKPRLPRLLSAVWATLALIGLTACGGGSDDNMAPPAPSAPSASLTLTGTAATGGAIVAAPIAVKCSTGEGNGTTSADGTFSISITGAAMPCIAELVTAGGTRLHSVAVGSASALVVNITPVTELVVASNAGMDPAAFFASFNASSAATLTPSSVSAAQSVVIAILTVAGIDLSTIGDLISTALKASTSTITGDAYDHALDGFATALASSGTTLTTFTTAVIGSTGAPDVASVAPALLLKPAAVSCSALRSGTYRLITPLFGTTLEAKFGLSTIDAIALSIVRADGSTGTLVANGPCRFTDTGTNYSADMVVSQAGVLLARYTTNGGTSYRTMIGFPEQAHAVADLAGQWNLFGMNPSGSVHVGVSGTAILSTSGQMSGAVNCENDASWAVDVCASVPDSVTGLLGPLVSNLDGGFDLPDAATGQVKTRVFAYASGSGALLLATVSNVGFSIWSKQAAVPLPNVGAASTSWNLDMNPDLSSNSATYETTNVVDSVDAAAGSWTRTHGTIGQAVTRKETIIANRPRPGLVFRPAGSVTGSDGTTVSVIREFTLLRLVGMGVSVGVLPGLKLFEFSANEP